MRSLALLLLLGLGVGCGAGTDDPPDVGSDDAGRDDGGLDDAGCDACERTWRDRIADPMPELTATARPGFAVLSLRDLGGAPTFGGLALTLY